MGTVRTQKRPNIEKSTIYLFIVALALTERRIRVRSFDPFSAHEQLFHHSYHYALTHNKLYFDKRWEKF